MNNLKDIQENLKVLGFGENASQIYLILLELGEITVGPIIKRTGLHRQIVYNNLEELINKKLVNKITKSNRQNFKIANPDVFLQKAEDYKKTADEVFEQIKELNSSLKFEQEIKIYEGISGFHEAHMEDIYRQPKNIPLNIIGAGGLDWFNRMKENNVLDKFEKIRWQKKISINLITFEGKRPEINQMQVESITQTEQRNKFFRFLPENLTNPVVTQIWHDNIEIIIYGTSVTIIKIKSPKVVENFNNYFQSLWKIAKP